MTQTIHIYNSLSRGRSWARKKSRDATYSSLIRQHIQKLERGGRTAWSGRPLKQEEVEHEIEVLRRMLAEREGDKDKAANDSCGPSCQCDSCKDHRKLSSWKAKDDVEIKEVLVTDPRTFAQKWIKMPTGVTTTAQAYKIAEEKAPGWRPGGVRT